MLYALGVLERHLLVTFHQVILAFVFYLAQGVLVRDLLVAMLQLPIVCFTYSVLKRLLLVAVLQLVIFHFTQSVLVRNLLVAML